MKFINHLTLVLKIELSFLISLKLSIKFGTKALLLTLNKIGVTGDLLNVLIDFLKEKNKQLPNMTNILSGQIFLQGFHKVENLDHCFS